MPQQQRFATGLLTKYEQRMQQGDKQLEEYNAQVCELPLPDLSCLVVKPVCSGVSF